MPSLRTRHKHNAFLPATLTLTALTLTLTLTLTRRQVDTGRARRGAPNGPVLHGQNGVLRTQLYRAVGQVHGHTF